MAKKGAAGPEYTEAGEPVWVMSGMSGMQVVGLTDDRAYVTEDDTLAKRAAKEMKRGASVADALADAEVQVPFGKIERVWYRPNRNSVDFEWATKKGAKSFKLMCEPAVRDEIFDELEERLGEDFVRGERKIKAGELIHYPLGCLGIAVMLAIILAVAVGGTGGYAGGAALVGLALLWLVATLLMPETAVELVPAE